MAKRTVVAQEVIGPIRFREEVKEQFVISGNIIEQTLIHKHTHIHHWIAMGFDMFICK